MFYFTRCSDMVAGPFLGDVQMHQLLLLFSKHLILAMQSSSVLLASIYSAFFILNSFSYSKNSLNVYYHGD